MVSQIGRVSSVKNNFDYLKDVYESCLERYLQNHKKIGDALNLINHGRKILQSDEELDTYIAFYGAHHYYKLVEAFDALALSIFGDRELEIVSYGCGAATDTCSLISYCHSKSLQLNIKNLTLIEPSEIALGRGIKYLHKALSDEELDKIKLKKIYKTIGELEEKDITSKSKISKLHVFSNVLDIQEINLESLASLINKTQSGTNYFICLNPQNLESKKRIDHFCLEMSNLSKLLNISTNNQRITGKRIWVMKYNQYIDNHPIHRYHKIFKIDFR